MTIDYDDPKYSEYASALVPVDWTAEDVDPNGLDPADVISETIDQIKARENHRNAPNAKITRG